MPRKAELSIVLRCIRSDLPCVDLIAQGVESCGVSATYDFLHEQVPEYAAFLSGTHKSPYLAGEDRSVASGGSFGVCSSQWGFVPCQWGNTTCMHYRSTPLKNKHASICLGEDQATKGRIFSGPPHGHRGPSPPQPQITFQESSYMSSKLSGVSHSTLGWQRSFFFVLTKSQCVSNQDCQLC